MNEAEKLAQLLQSGQATQDPAPTKPQPGLPGPAKWPETTYEQGLRRAREILETPGGKLKELTAKQATFIQAILDGATNSEAYRFAYDNNLDKPAVINHRASDLMKLPHIAYELFIARRRNEERLLRDRGQAQRFVVEHLQRIVEMPGTHHSARVNALNLLGKYAGLFGEAGAAQDKDKRSPQALEAEIIGRLRVIMGNSAPQKPVQEIIDAEATEVPVDDKLDD